MESFLIGASEFSWLSLESWIAMIKMVIGFGFIIFVHEAGHFLVAKACGVKCEKFYVGFDAFDVRIGDFVLIPRRLFHFQWGETEYGIGIIPLGGYVKMLGQDDNPANQSKERERTKLSDESASSEGGSAEASSSDAQAENEDRPVQLDPRSYPAKSVPQRFAIISAGVIMNLIFAVIFASIAFGIGAPYQPSMIGGVTPGGPAWKADIQPGTRVIQINDDQKPPEHLRWQDLAGSVALTGVGHPIRLKVTTRSSEQPTELTLIPEAGLMKMKYVSLGTVGIEAATSNKLATDRLALFPGMAASKAVPALAPGDEIIAIDGRPTEFGFDIKREFLSNWDQPVKLTVRRTNDKETQTLEIEVPVQPYQDLGVQVEFGVIGAVQANSPAETAGLKAGDRITAIDGSAVSDPVLFAERMRRVARDSGTVALTVAREGSTEPLELTIAPRLPRYSLDLTSHLPMGIDELGITLAIGSKIAAVRSGSSAQAQKLQAGDQIVELQFLENGKPLTAKSQMPFPLEKVTTEEFPHVWQFVMESVQYFGPDHSLSVTVDRAGTPVTVELRPQVMEGEFSRSRGIRMQPYRLILTAKTFNEAVALGFREAKEDASQVYLTLRQMLLGRVSAINLRGPGTIAAGATQMALEGDAVLLLFLALISANLAVVNFLPIPVLDGGHAVFLIYEGIFRKPPPEHMVFWLSMAGLGMLLLLMAFVLTMDILQWIVQ